MYVYIEFSFDYVMFHSLKLHEDANSKRTFSRHYCNDAVLYANVITVITES